MNVAVFCFHWWAVYLSLGAAGLGWSCHFFLLIRTAGCNGSVWLRTGSVPKQEQCDWTYPGLGHSVFARLLSGFTNFRELGIWLPRSQVYAINEYKYLFWKNHWKQLNVPDDIVMKPGASVYRVSCLWRHFWQTASYEWCAKALNPKDFIHFVMFWIVSFPQNFLLGIPLNV